MAKRLLLTTDDKLYVVAMACGFENPHQLTRVFTREIGISPAHYRQRRSTSAEPASRNASR
jgi:transcriptional regulator GlxA family with amidase domain